MYTFILRMDDAWYQCSAPGCMGVSSLHQITKIKQPNSICKNVNLPHKQFYEFCQWKVDLGDGTIEKQKNVRKKRYVNWKIERKKIREIKKNI